MENGDFVGWLLKTYRVRPTERHSGGVIDNVGASARLEAGVRHAAVEVGTSGGLYRS